MADGFTPQFEDSPAALQRSRHGDLISRAVAARLAIEAALDAALTVLDDMDGDTDLEPVNGSAQATDQRDWAAGGDEDEREPDHDYEPSLAGFGAFGSTQDMEEEFGGLGDKTDQRRWAEDHAEEGDGEPDLEPSLGSSSALDQCHWAGGPTGKARHVDREWECEDEGAQVDAELSMGWGAPNTWSDPLIPCIGRPGDGTSSLIGDAEL